MVTTADLPKLAREVARRGREIKELEWAIMGLTKLATKLTAEKDELRALLQDQAAQIEALKAQIKELEW